MLARFVPTVMAAVVALSAGQACAERLIFTSELNGAGASTATPSKAQGRARIVVDTDAQTVDMELVVRGLKTDELWTTLVKAPIGPVHLHVYGHGSHDPDNSALAFPFPYGASYAPTAEGFKVEAKGYRYDLSAASVGSKASFDEFVHSMRAGDVALNIHTNAYHDGEIGGPVVAVKP
ncbi:MAG: CHRD domain-containing protein [Proteobacteria bacterium]|nr:CHRD domain-containing protein [Pseudomonadota bacterium]